MKEPKYSSLILFSRPSAHLWSLAIDKSPIGSLCSQKMKCLPLHVVVRLGLDGLDGLE